LSYLKFYKFLLDIHRNNSGGLIEKIAHFQIGNQFVSDLIFEWAIARYDRNKSLSMPSIFF